MAPVTVTALIQDADGVTYQVPAGVLPADGQRHAPDHPAAGPRQASYPLRLLGLTLMYALPPYDAANPLASPTADLSIESLAVAKDGQRPVRPRRSATVPPWRRGRARDRRARVPTGPAGTFQTSPPSDGAPPADPGLARRRRGRPATHVQRPDTSRRPRS